MNGQALMTHPRRTRGRGRPRPTWRSLSVPALILLPALAIPQTWDVDWHSVDGGGEVLAETADGQWQLSGALGQWDSTELIEQSGGGYTLTGGFWPVNIDQTDILFRDGFEG